MNAMRLIVLGLLASGSAMAGSANTQQQPQVWEKLTPFRNFEQFNEYRQKARQIAKLHGYWWASMRAKYAGGPLLAQNAAPAEAAPCDPAVQDCGEGKELEEVVTTGLRASAGNASITNNQEAGVDEGDIVKAYDRFIVVLQHGRLFSVDTGDTSGQLRLVDRVNVYQSEDLDSWIDEVLIFGDTLLVTGYSYKEDASNIALFRIDKDGDFRFLARYFIESEDYYSWENYATRIVDGKLIIYTPFDLSQYGREQEFPLPRIRRWTEQGGYTPWQPLFSITDVYKPIQPAFTPAMHVVSACSINLAEALECRSRGIVGPWEHEMYVSADHVYLWLAPDSDDLGRGRHVEACAAGEDVFKKPGWPSAAYRMTISSGVMGAVHTEGFPPDQFALAEQRGALWALVRRPPLECDLPDVDDGDNQPLALANIPLDAFSIFPPHVESSDHFRVPAVSGWDLQSRFSDGYLLYGSAQGRARAVWRGEWGSEPYTNGNLAVIRLAAPRQAAVLEMPHSVDRIELFGRNAVAFGYQPNDDYAVSSVALGRHSRRSDTQAMPGVFESEGRSHAFNALAEADGSGIFGIPTMDSETYRNERYGDTPVDVQFIVASNTLDLDAANKIAGTPESQLRATGYTCEVSCVDWYGNARPIFYRGRIFALIGLDFVEGALSDRRVVEVTRLNLAAAPEHVRPMAAN